MTKVDKEVEIQKAITEKNKASIEKVNIIRIEDEESSSSSSMSMYNLCSNKEYLEVPSYRSPTLILQDSPFERHSVIQEEEHPSSYNI